MFTPNALKVLSKRYLTRGPDGQVLETPEDLLRRVARAIAAPEAHFDRSPWHGDQKPLEERFYRMMLDGEFMPNSPTLMNAGKPLGQLSACFVLPIEDSMEGIFDAIKHAAMIHKSGGGTGFAFSRLRPANDIVASTNGVSSGPVSFMRVFNIATETIKQGGTRRGANMAILRVDHPDILDFIRSKEDNTALTNFNISIAVTNAFMDAVARDGEYELFNPRNQQVSGRLQARKVFNLMVEGAWRNGEPGIVFLDRINRDNPTPHVGAIESTNPCGEQPLLPYESCNLGSLNVARFAASPDSVHRIDYPRLKEAIHHGVRFLDNVIEANRYPLPAIEQMTRSNRKIGLGIMGWADLLVQLEIPYSSESALTLAEEMMGFINREAWNASADLARERGAYPNFPGSVQEKKGRPPVRNATVTTIAPTGTISILANCSSGIEPLFAIAYEKHVMDGERLVEVHPYFLEVAGKRGFLSDDLLQRIAQSGSLAKIEEIPSDVRRIFCTSHDILPEWHVRMQAAFQKFTDNAVSKTVNFPHDATMRDVERVFQLAHTLGCKGITVYRDGSRDEQVLNVGSGKAKGKGETTPSGPIARPRPELTQGSTERVKIGCGNLYVTVNSDDRGVCEVFTSLGRAGGCPSQSEATARLISTALRAGLSVEQIVDQLKGIRCLSTLKRGPGTNGTRVLSCPDAIGRAIERFHNQWKSQKTEGLPPREGLPPVVGAGAVVAAKSGSDPSRTWVADSENFGQICPDCGEGLEHEGGCIICRSCGYSKCG